MDYSSPKELLAAMVSILPSLADEWHRDHPDPDTSKQSIYSVYATFLPHLGSVQLDDWQIARVASLLNDAVAAGGKSENAVSTCVLEHLDKRLEKLLRPFLSMDTKRRLSASFRPTTRRS